MPPLYFNLKTGEVHADLDIENIDDPSTNIKKLANIVVDSEFDFTANEFPRKPKSEWQKDLVVDLGRRIVEDLADLEEPTAFSRPIAQRLYLLGVLPHWSYFRSSEGRFNGLDDYKNVIGAKEVFYDPHHEINRNKPYESLDIPSLAELILANYNSIVNLEYNKNYRGPLSTNIVEQLNRMALAPSTNYILQNFGGLTELNIYLGFPDVRSWDNDEFIMYGATVMKYNGPDSLTPANINALARMKYGPQYDTIRRRLGWSKFKSLSHAEFDRIEQENYVHMQEVETNYLQNFGNLNATAEEMKRFWGVTVLLDYYGKPSVDVGNKSVNHVVSQLIKKDPSITLGEVETQAHILNIYDDLWPSKPPLRPPILVRDN